MYPGVYTATLEPQTNFHLCCNHTSKAAIAIDCGSQRMRTACTKICVLIDYPSALKHGYTGSYMTYILASLVRDVEAVKSFYRPTSRSCIVHINIAILSIAVPCSLVTTRISANIQVICSKCAMMVHQVM